MIVSFSEFIYLLMKHKDTDLFYRNVHYSLSIKSDILNTAYPYQGTESVIIFKEVFTFATTKLNHNDNK